MSGGKNRKQKVESEVKLDPDIKRAAMEQFARAKQAAAIGSTPNLGPTIAAFTPQERAAFENANTMARAFGMQAGPVQAPQGQMVGGVRGLSIEPAYRASVGAMDPEQRDMIEEFFAMLREDAAAPRTNRGNNGKMSPTRNPAAAAFQRRYGDGDDGGHNYSSGGSGTYGGYTSVKDMFDGGGPGASGGQFSGGGRLSRAANAVTGRGDEDRSSNRGGK